MPNWSTEPPPSQKHMAFTLIRTPADRPLTAIATCEELIGCETHFWGGRTVPCEKPNCRACNESVPFRWHAYLTAYDPKTRDHFIFECTAHAAMAFTDYRSAHGTLRGCYFQAVRPKRGKNSKVEIATKPADIQKINLPEPPDLIKAMSVIWQLPAGGLPTSPGLDGHKQIRADARTLKQVTEQTPDVDEPPSIGSILSDPNPKPRKQK